MLNNRGTGGIPRGNKERKSKIVIVTILMVFLILMIGTNAGAAPEGAPSYEEISKYIVVTFGDDSDVGRSLPASQSEIGANRVVLSTPTDPGGCPPNGGYPNLVSTFGNGRWNTATNPDQMNGAATLFQGTSFSGEVALTSDNGAADVSNSIIFATTGIQGVLANPLAGASNSEFEDTGGPTTDCSGATALALGNGASGGNNFAALLAEYAAWKTFLTGLSAEMTITNVDDWKDGSSFAGNNGDDGLRTNYDASDTNGDNIVVVDINIGGNTWDVSDIDWVLEGSGEKLIVFRLLGGTNLNVNNSSVQMGENYAEEDNSIAGVGAIFLSYTEGSGSGDTVFNAGSNVVLTGIAWWDLNVVGEGGNTKPVLNYNNSQGCGQLVSQRINLQNARWDRCAELLPTAISLQSTEVTTPDTLPYIIAGLLFLSTATFIFLRQGRQTVPSVAPGRPEDNQQI